MISHCLRQSLYAEAEKQQKIAPSGYSHFGSNECCRHCSHAQTQATTVLSSVYMSCMWVPCTSRRPPAMPSLQSDLYVLPQGRTLCKSMPQQGCSRNMHQKVPQTPQQTGMQPADTQPKPGAHALHAYPHHSQ